MNRNRDFWSDPTQNNGRSSPTYGHTTLHNEPVRATEPRWMSALVVLLFGCAVALVMML